MTKLELIRKNIAAYDRLVADIPTLSGLQKAVAVNMTGPGLKANGWIGGLGSAGLERAARKVLALGYNLDEIEEEHLRQMEIYC